MPKNTMDDLRNHLFATIEALQDEEKPMDIDRAEAICHVADRLIDTAKVEVKVLDIVGQVGAGPSRFLSAAEPEKPAPRILEESQPPTRPQLVANVPKEASGQ